MFRIFGPPGTGKDYQTIEHGRPGAFEWGQSPGDCVFLLLLARPLPKQKKEPLKRFDLDPDTDLFYFRTLHSLTYKMLNLKEKDLMRGPQFQELSERIGFQLNTIKKCRCRRR